MLNIAIVGSGYISECHIDACLALPQGAAVISAIIARNPVTGPAMAEKAGCPWYRTLEEAVAAQPVDVVDICLPTHLHKDFCLQAAAMKKHVFCEKPVALTLADFDAMEAVCRENGVKLMAAQVVRYMPEFCEIACRLRAGALGPLHFLTEKRLVQAGGEKGWRDDPAQSGGALFDLSIHDVDFLYGVFGMPERIHAAGWKSPTGCWDHVVLTLRWPGGLHAVCEGSLCMTGAFPYSVECRVIGDRGTLMYSNTAGENLKDRVSQYSFLFYPVGGTPQTVAVTPADPFLCELQAFLKAVENDTPVPIPPAESRAVLRLLLAAKESLETGRPIDMTTF